MNRKSFTIVEIMVVMAVIGIIMTLSIIGIQAAQKQQRVTTITNDMNQFRLALASYYSEYRMYPIPGNSIVLDDIRNQVCLFEPGSTSLIVDRCETVTNRVFKLDLSQPGMQPSTNSLNQVYTPCSSAEAIEFGGLPDQDIVIPTPEQWVLDYRYESPATRPQSYKIRYCDESGPTEFLSQ